MDQPPAPQPAPQPTAFLTPRDRRWLEILLVLGSVALFFVVVQQLAMVWAVFSDLILVFFFAWLLGFVLEPVAGWLARFMPRLLAVAIAYGAVAIAAFGLVVVSAAALIGSISDFLRNLPQLQQSIVDLLRPVADWLRTLGLDQVNLTAQIDTILATIATQARDLLGPLQDVAVASVGFVGNLAITVWAPLCAARRAASTLVSMPPLPIALPAPPAIAASAGSSARASRISVACASRLGSAEYRPCWSVRMMSASASTRLVTRAPSVSLSPTLISSVTTVSFSLITGTTPCASSVSRVLRAFR